MRFRWLAVVAVAVLSCGFASAQPKDTGPTVEVRLRSVNDLVDKFEYVGGLVGKEDAVKQARELIKVLSAEGKGVEGIDPKKPFGAYATLTKDIETSPFVLMIPIANEDQFLLALKNRLEITTEKGENGTLKATVPVINEAHLRFLNGYAYVARTAKDLDPKTLITPKAYFAKDDGSVASLLVHIDRIPDDLKTFAMGQFELGLNEQRKKNAENESAAEKQLKNLVFDTILGSAKGLADDGKELSVKLFVDPKTDTISAEATLTAKSGSPMAKNFAALAKKTSLPAGIVASAANPAARGSVKVGLPDGMKKDYTAAVDALLKELVKNAKPQEEEIVKQFVDAIGPTLKAGELDAAAALTGPDAKGRYLFIAAAGISDGKKIEKFVKDISGFAGGAADFTFDIEKVGDFSLHRIDINQIDEKFEKLFGTKSIWVAVSDKHIALCVEPDGATLKKALKAKAVPVPVASVDISAAKLVQLAQPDLKPDELKALIKGAFGDGPTSGKDSVTVSVEGGNQLTVKFKANGKVLRLFAGLDFLKGK